MFYVDSLQIDFDITLTLGAVDTKNPPPLAIGFKRKGTNEDVRYNVPILDVTPGSHNIKISSIPTSIFKGTGEYHYIIYDYTNPLILIEIERGLFIITSEKITKKTYGTDRTRAEFKGYI